MCVRMPAPQYCRTLRCLQKHAPTAVLGRRRARQLLLRLLLRLLDRELVAHFSVLVAPQPRQRSLHRQQRSGGTEVRALVKIDGYWCVDAAEGQHPKVGHACCVLNGGVRAQVHIPGQFFQGVQVRKYAYARTGVCVCACVPVSLEHIRLGKYACGRECSRGCDVAW
jgi:hypothetical protein